MSTFVFFHVGPDISQPAMLAHSIKLTNPGARIIQCTDLETPEVPRATEVHRVACDRGRIMIARLEGFAKLGLDKPAIYLDTDMLVIKRIAPSELLGGRTALLCKRSFNLEGAFVGNQRGIDFTEYDGMPLGQVYPYVACATISKDSDFWHSLAEILHGLEAKYMEWYGDQEAMRAWASKTKSSAYGFLPESTFGCLPEEKKFLPSAQILHFKGAHRKALMAKFYKKIISSIIS